MNQRLNVYVMCVRMRPLCVIYRVAGKFCVSFILRIGQVFVVCGNKFLRFELTEISAGN